MTKLSDGAQVDLHSLAISRVEQSINSVGQLLETNEQQLHLLLTVLTAVATSAAKHMHTTLRKPNGEVLSLGESYCRVLSMMAAAQGLGSAVMSEEEANQHGLT